MDPILRRSDLNYTDASHYDWLVAAPSDDVLMEAWYIFSISSLVTSLSCLVLIVTILASPKLRSRTFNVYILFLTIPDFFFSFMCSITCFLNIKVGKFYSDFGCQFQSWYCAFSWSASMWMNVLIAHELFILLKIIASGSRLKQRSKRMRVIQIVCVYAFSAFVSSWTLIDPLPHRARPVSGLACLPTEYDKNSSLFFWLIYIPAILGIPFIYITTLICIVLKRHLLPYEGNCRYLAIFFVRLLLVFIVMWLPAVILIYLVGGRSVWAAIFGGTWSHLQGLVSALLCFSKPDIRDTLFKVFPCKFRSNTNTIHSDIAEHKEQLFGSPGNVLRQLPFRSCDDDGTNEFIQEDSPNSDI